MAQDFVATVTDAGMELLNSTQAGDGTIEIVRVAVGSGIYDEAEKKEDVLKERTTLKEENASYPINSKEIVNKGIKITANVTNYDEVNKKAIVEEGFYINEIGIYVRKAGEEKEVLFALSVVLSDDHGDLMPAYNGYNPTSIVQTYVIEIDNAEQIQTVLPPEEYALQVDLDKKVQNSEDGVNDALGKLSISEEETQDNDICLIGRDDTFKKTKMSIIWGYLKSKIIKNVDDDEGISKVYLKKNGDASDVTQTFDAADKLEEINSGEKNSTLFGKISKAITDLIAHIKDEVVHITKQERENWNSAHKHSLADHAPSNAQKNQNAFGNVKVGTVTLDADGETSTFTISAGSNVSIEVDKATKTITISSKDTVYTHPTSAGSKHIPSGGSSGQILRWSADGTAAWGADNDTTYSNFVKSGSGAKAGLVPAPSTTAGTTKYLREDGTWTVPPDTKPIYQNNLTTSASGYGLDARQGKALNDKITELNTNLDSKISVVGRRVSSSSYAGDVSISSVVYR